LLVGDGGHPLQQDRIQSWVHRLESHWPTVLGSVVLTLLLSVWFAVYGAPQVAQWAADRLPPSASAYVGQDTLAVLDRTVFQPSQLDSARQQQLQVVFAGLLPEDQEGLHYRLLFRGGGKIGANAFALPDASIVMTDELVKLAENDAQLAVIFLHEIGHVRGRHLLRQVIQQAGLAALLVTITGDISGASSMVLAMPGVLMQAQYSQSMEYEADTYALEHLAAHGLSPLAFAQIMRRMDSERESSAGQPEKTGESPEVGTTETGTTETGTEEKDTFGQYWSSHPATAERINRFEQAAGQH
jgi:Zn-dependent protease with chaperone function